MNQQLSAAALGILQSHNYRSSKLNRRSRKAPARRKSDRKITLVTFTLVVLIAVIAVSAIVQNRGFRVEVNPKQIGLTLQPAEQPSPSMSTYNPSSPIVTGPGAHVVTEAKGPNRSQAAGTTPNSGMSTHGAASPIVTGEGAVVKSTVDTRP